MRVDVWSDVVCPWCYLGKARFERALDAFGPQPRVEVVYRSFELDPDWPQGQTIPVREMLAIKYQLAAAEASGPLPLEYMLEIMRDEAAEPHRRDWAAQARGAL